MCRYASDRQSLNYSLYGTILVAHSRASDLSTQVRCIVILESISGKCSQKQLEGFDDDWLGIVDVFSTAMGLISPLSR